MKLFNKIKTILAFDTYGAIAVASFIICAFSGVVLAIPYDINNPYVSITTMLIANPAAVFFRNIHYWSAQFFLAFTLLHLWDHIKQGSERKLNSGVWLRLTLSILFTFFVMITGFILKADADSIQARRILTTLISKFPLFGDLISYGLFGPDDDFQILYVHHIATATIFVAIIIWEHAKTLWTKLSTFIITLIILTVFSFIFHAPLHNWLNPVVKGPWYFVGLQEVLHWVSNPVFVLFFILLLVLAIYALYFISDYKRQIIKKGILYLFYVYIILTIIGFLFRGENWSWQVPWKTQYITSDIFRSGFDIPEVDLTEISTHDIPQIGERKEACLICHSNVTGFAASHDPQAIGCASCHLGDPFTLDKNRAHRNMVLIPGNLSNAQQTCGSLECHPEIISRVNTSLMTTNSGIVSVDRFVFGETESPDIHSHIREIGHTAADKHLRDLCAKCHLGNEKMETSPIDEMSRGGGCTACHLNYSNQSTNEHLAYISGQKNEDLLPSIHPSLNIQISNDHCFGCHSRSGRISTNYEGWHETLLDEKEVTGKKKFRILQDKRVFEFVAADVHHTAGLECIDCHNAYELMGDGVSYLHEEQAVKIRCEDCHFEIRPKTVSYNQLDSAMLKIFDLRKYAHNDKKMIRGMDSELALMNTYFKDDTAFLVGKNSGKTYPLNSPEAICTKNHAHESLTCSSCHTAWAPQCIGCHNEFDRNAEGYDLLENKFVKGSWVEYVGNFLADLPTLGVRVGQKNKIEPAIPGMIMTIDTESFYSSDDLPDGKAGLKSSDESIIFHRLFSPAAPHTTSAKGRSCKSCHNNPLAIGYGRGELIFEMNNGTGKWKFTPEFAANKYDGLPEDAWIGFSFDTPHSTFEVLYGLQSARTDFRSFTIEEQKQILTVGACLFCHDENSEIILKSLDEDFEKYLSKISEKCVLPEW